MIGIGSTPVSAVRPAKTETMEGTSAFKAAKVPRTCSSAQKGGHVELHPGGRQILDQGQRRLARAAALLGCKIKQEVVAA